MKAVKLQIRAPCLCRAPTFIVKVITVIIIAILVIVIWEYSYSNNNTIIKIKSRRSYTSIRSPTLCFGILPCSKPFEAN